VVSYTILIHHYGKAGEVEKAVEIAKIMAKEGRKPNSAMYTALVSKIPFYALLSPPPHLFLPSTTLTPSLSFPFLTPQISALGQNGRAKEALHSLHKMIELDLPPNVKTFGAVIQSLAANGFLDDALGVVKLMEDKKVKMDAG